MAFVLIYFDKSYSFENHAWYVWHLSVKHGLHCPILWNNREYIVLTIYKYMYRREKGGMNGPVCQWAS